jgi:hypothetical protein
MRCEIDGGAARLGEWSVMRDIGRRLDRIEEVLGDIDCLCDSGPEVGILVIEPGWNESRISLAEDEILGACPVHGLQRTPILRLSGSDVYG